MRLRPEYAVALIASAMLSIPAVGQPQYISPPRVFLLCDPPPPDPCGGKAPCGIIVDEIDMTIDSRGQIAVNGEKVTQGRLKEYVEGWAKDGILPFVVSGRVGASYSQVAWLVSLVRRAGAKRVACYVPNPLGYAAPVPPPPLGR